MKKIKWVQELSRLDDREKIELHGALSFPEVKIQVLHDVEWYLSGLERPNRELEEGWENDLWKLSHTIELWHDFFDDSKLNDIRARLSCCDNIALIHGSTNSLALSGGHLKLE